MYEIIRKEALKPTVILYEIAAPMIAKKAQPGQFIILRVDENGERIPITIHDYDREKGTVSIIVHTAGATTEKLSHKKQGEHLRSMGIETSGPPPFSNADRSRFLQALDAASARAARKA